MLIRSWLKLVSQCVYRATRYRRMRPRRLRKRRNYALPLACEVLEDRTLLSSSLVFTAGAATPKDVTLRADGSTVEVVDSSNFSTVLASELLSNITSGAQISGNGFNVNLTVDSSTPQIPGGIVFIGGSGTNTLGGPAADTTWNVTGPGSGALARGLLRG